jgi:hypothetical protein
MSEDDADAKERAEAEALAAALDGRAPAAPEVRDALEAAQLLRFSGGQGELDAARSEALLQELLDEAEGAPAARPRGRVTRLWPIGVALSAAAAALLFLAIPARREPAGVASREPAKTARQERASVLPTPSSRLLAAQTALVQDGAGHAARFEQEMRGYRSELFRALEAAYPAPLSAVQDDLRRRR